MSGRIIEGLPELGREVTPAQSGVLEPTQASSQKPTGKFSEMLHDDWRHSDSMNLAMVGIFIPWILADIAAGGIIDRMNTPEKKGREQKTDVAV